MVRLLHRSLGVREFSLAATRVIGRAVSFDGVCILTMDPATLLPTGEIVENGLPSSTAPRMTEIELVETDFNKFAQLARSRARAATLSEATGGKLDRSVRHRELKRPHGFGDELRAALVGDSGTWGGLTLLRQSGRPRFSSADTALVASISRLFVEGLQRAMVLGAPTSEAHDSEDTGLLLLADDDSIAAANHAAQALLAELGDGGPGDRPPVVIRAAAGRARTAAQDAVQAEHVASGRVRTAAGNWLLVRASMLGGQAAVILEHARPPELAPLIAHAYGLTERERAITQLVAQGLATNDIAGRLHLAPYTVQDHLTSIFEKVGVRTRGELVARVFFEQYAPRMTGGAPIGSDGWFAPVARPKPPPGPERRC